MSEDHNSGRRRPTGAPRIPTTPPPSAFRSLAEKVQIDGTYSLPRTRPPPPILRRQNSDAGSSTIDRNNNTNEESFTKSTPNFRTPLTPRSITAPSLSSVPSSLSSSVSSLPSSVSSTSYYSTAENAPPNTAPPLVPGGRQFVNPEVPGYVGFANLPNQVHRKSVKKGFEFTLMVVGESGLGKSTLVNSLFLTDLYPDRQIPGAADKLERTVKIEASTVEIEERGVKLRLTVVDTPGFADAINNGDSFKPIIKYIDDQFEKYLQDESGLNRRNIVDSRVHCCFYFINPAGHGLKPLDIAFMKAVHHKVNIVPVIAKADTLTRGEVNRLKHKILEEVGKLGIRTYPMPDCDSDEDEDYKEQCKQLKAAVPFAVVGSNQVIEVRGRKVRGRMYPWGVVEVENPDHCDFIKIRTMLITHMQDLQEVTHEVHYENFRSERLAEGGGAPANRKTRTRRNEGDDISERERQLAEKEAELKRMQDMIMKMQSEMQRGSATNIPAGLPPSNGQINGVAKSQPV